MSILLDTNALIWLLDDDVELGQRATEEIDQALRTSRLLVSAASFWEVAMLVAKKRLVLDRAVSRWRVDAMRSGIEEVPLDGQLAIESVALPYLHADPADRFVVATALQLRAKLVTSDARLLAWKGPLACMDARV
jgi:PIN domain nuclease of toxin-antitoxin system